MRARGWSWPAVMLGALGLACVGPVLASAASGLVRAVIDGAPIGTNGLERLATSVAVASGIALGATAIGWFTAAAAWRDRWLGFLLIPLCMPPYLAYTGWGLMLAPMTTLGDAVARLGGRWPLIAGQSLAIAGLVLWSWPIAALVLILARRRVHPAILDSMRMEPLHGWRRHAELLRLLRPAVILAFFAVALLMLGSAVPLHLARVETYAIDLWRELDSGPGGVASAWARAWPILFIALAAPCLPRRDWSADEPAHASRHAATPIPVLTALALSVVLPGVLLARAAGWQHTWRFWRVQGEAASSSAAIALGVAAAGTLLAVLAWRTLDQGSRASAWFWARVFVAGALVPGVLVGSAVSAGWRWAPIVGETSAAVVVAHLARFGFVALLAGAWAHATMPRGLNALRAIDGATSFMGWARSAWPLSRGIIVAAGCVLGCLSMHEIESAVMVQPPGVRSLSREILQRLHSLREQDAAAAAIWIIAVGLGLACLAALAGRGSLRRVNEPGPVS